MDEPRFDVVWGESGEPYLDYHFCREWGCYGTDQTHGFTFEAAREEIARWYEEKARRWRAMTFEEWANPRPAALGKPHMETIHV